ncbi:ABC transporter ATP-binding protein [Thermosulfuriphilus sp.]
MIEASSLSRFYNGYPAVREISFRVAPGEILGLLGPNGAGKTTVLKILSTQIVPTSGTALVAGADILRDPLKVRASVGYLPEILPLYNQMEVGEYLTFVAEARGLEGQRFQERMAFVREALSLVEVWHHPLASLSKGYRQRVGVAQAIVHDPPVLILDEPTTGLDPLQILEIRNLIREMAREKAIIFSSHILSEVEAISDRIAILNEGQMVAQGSLDELARTAGASRVVRLVSKTQARQALSGIAGLKGIKESFRGDCWEYRIISSSEIALEEIFQVLSSKGIKILEFCQQPIGLEEIFILLIGGRSNGSYKDHR